ncbi:c-type cytochrome biogenesis protein CcmI, partial [Pseudomonas aeruginosa]|nr:c-type cytochrome biogenesis protein CcmI [Pseudomonas aeruginosa]
MIDFWLAAGLLLLAALAFLLIPLLRGVDEEEVVDELAVARNRLG